MHTIALPLVITVLGQVPAPISQAQQPAAPAPPMSIGDVAPPAEIGSVTDTAAPLVTQPAATAVQPMPPMGNALQSPVLPTQHTMPSTPGVGTQLSGGQGQAYNNSPNPNDAMVKNIVAPPPGSAGLTGKPMSVSELVQAVNAGSQRQAIRTYWSLFEHMGLYHSALREADYLKNINYQNVVQQEQIDLAHMQAIERVERLRRSAVSLQRQLAQLTRTTGTNELPRPSITFVGEYHTRYETMRAQGYAGSSAYTIHEELPIAYAYLVSVQPHAGAATQHLAQLANQQSSGPAVFLDTARTARAYQKAYLRAVRVYNQLIGDYVTSLSIPGRTPKMVAEMIATPSRQQTELARVRGNIRRQSGEVQVADERAGKFVQPAFREVPVRSETSVNSRSDSILPPPSTFR